MMEDALAAASQILTPPFRTVLWKTLALTLALLGLVWIALHKLLVASLALSATWAASLSSSWAHSWIVAHSWMVSWAAAALSLIGGLGLTFGLAFLVTPVSFIVAGFFFDDLAEHVELTLRPGEAPGRALALHDSIWLSVQFAAVALLVNAAALLLLLVPGLNAAVFFGANAYLSGRGYFELAAARHLPFAEVRRLRQGNALRLFGAGLVMAALLTVPVLNLLTPLFGTAFMVRVTSKILRDAGKAPRLAS
jgi:CysZ protein